MRTPRPPLTAPEMARLLSEQSLQLGPFRLDFEFADGLDGILRAHSSAPKLERRFACELHTEWSRRNVERMLAHLSERSPSYPPLLVFPYLSGEALEELQARKVSGIDLCGNGLLFDPPRLFVLATGAKKLKQYRAPPLVSAIYRSRSISTLVPRVFLLQPSFPGVKAVMEACHLRMFRGTDDPPPLTFPTVSKAIVQLEEDLLVRRSGRELKLLDPARLLADLARAFAPPVESGRFLGKTQLSSDALWSALQRLGPNIGAVVTGRGSAAHYTGLAGPERLQLYVRDIRPVVAELALKATQAFPNIELIETAEEPVYFDAREHGGIRWASPLQTYFELAEGTAREVTVAEELRVQLLNELALQIT